MTDTSKTRTPAKRDTYDDFLDMTEGKSAAPAKKKTASATRKSTEKDAATQKKSATGRKASSADASKKKAAKRTPADAQSRDLLAAWEELSGEKREGDGATRKKPRATTSASKSVQKRESPAKASSQPSKTGSGTRTRSTSSTAKKSAAKDPYDDFLDGTAKPSTSKIGSGTRTRSTSSTAKKSAAKDSYDDFLDGTTKPSTQKTGSGTRSRSTSSTAKKGAAKDPYDDFLDGTAKPSTARKSAGKSRRRSAVLLVDNDSGRDPFDDYLDAADEKPAKRPGGARHGLTVALIAGILCILGLAGWQTVQYRTFLVMKSAVNQQTFYSGTTVEGVDVSGMTLAQALKYWEESVEPGYYGRTVSLNNGTSLTAAELGYSSDYATVLTNAWSAGRAGTLEERYEAISNRRRDPVSYTVSRVPYAQEAIQASAAAIAEQVNRPAKNAAIESFDTETYQFTFSDETVGSSLDAEALAADMARALDAGGGAVELKVEAVQPEVKKADIASSYGMVTSAVTNASSSSSNRLNNIRLALSMINGTCLKPGETFSFNETVGKRTTERGFKKATAYSGGEVTEEVGGGICQVSTTLFNAAVKADLEIVERHNHSLTVAYVDKGKDASVNWSSQDLRFINNSGDNLYICCLLDGDKRVRVGIFGKLLPNGEYITVEGVTTGTIPYETVMQPSLNVAPGSTQVTQRGKNGYTAEAYKLRWDANGNRISRELLCKSSYKAVNEIIEYGP